MRKEVRRPGIEPGSQEWESCMIPLHQRRSYTIDFNILLIFYAPMTTVMSHLLRHFIEIHALVCLSFRRIHLRSHHLRTS